MSNWFAPAGWLYRPVSWQGWLITLFTVLLSVWVTVLADRESHSVSDTLAAAFPYAAIFFGGAMWVASKTTREN